MKITHSGPLYGSTTYEVSIGHMEIFTQASPEITFARLDFGAWCGFGWMKCGRNCKPQFFFNTYRKLAFLYFWRRFIKSGKRVYQY